MKIDREGSLTIEAVISLTVFLFFMMFMANFGHIYRVQNFMTHSLAQSGQMIAFSSYAYEKRSLISDFKTIKDYFMMFEGVPVDGIEIRQAWMTKNYSEAAAYAFKYCAGGDKDTTNALTEKYRIESIDFTGTNVVDDDLLVRVKYTIHIPFAFFGIERVDMHQQIVCRLWK